ncbi:MAG: hypothetical protein ACRCZ0_08810 [Cetobacterium sp.]
MKKIILSIFLLMSIFSYSLREVNGVLYREYVNERFGFLLEYPAEVLFMQPPPTNGDGRTFISEDQESEMFAFGTYSLLTSSSDEIESSPTKKIVKDDYYYALAGEYSKAKVTYKRLNEADGWYVISGIMNEKIFYKKVRLIKGSDPYFIVFQMNYPVFKKNLYNKILEVVSKSIKY